MRCPKDQRDLAPEAGSLGCSACGGGLYERVELDAAFPRYADELVLETRLDSGAFKETVRCPSCAGAMAPWHLPHAYTWVEVCGRCQLYWLDQADRQNAKERSKLAARQAAVASLSAEDRKAFASALAESERGEGVEISPFHRLLALFGFPVVTRQLRERSPVATWSLSLALFLIFAINQGTGLLSPESWGYRAGNPNPLTLLTANFVHFGWLHLIGNLYFLIAFGDGVEQRTSRRTLVLAFVFGGALALLLDSLLQHPGLLMGGASAGVAVLMGMCVRLQPQAQVTTRLLITLVVRVSIVSYAFLELCYQTFMAMFGSDSVAWVAHLSGLVLGLILGEILRRRLPAG